MSKTEQEKPCSGVRYGDLTLGDPIKDHFGDAVLGLPDDQHRVAARSRQFAHLEVEFHAADASAGGRR